MELLHKLHKKSVVFLKNAEPWKFAVHFKAVFALMTELIFFLNNGSGCSLSLTVTALLFSTGTDVGDKSSAEKSQISLWLCVLFSPRKTVSPVVFPSA